ncbi:sialidase family protein [Streptomyces buecherae]|uniref:sialidase family protein n=1 Tax=Streptomyces buecherae TaxID=2763006 RepID=UPI0033F52540
MIRTLFRRRRPWGAAALVLTIAAVPLTAQAFRKSDDTPRAAACTTSTPFVSGTAGYHTFRIPALVRVGGDLVAFAEGRRTSAADHGDIEVVSRRSTDGGCRWGPLARVSDNGRNVAGNPAPVVDRASGDIVLLTTRQSGSVTQPKIEAGAVSSADSRRVYVQRSADAGRSWSRATEITRSVKPAGWRWYATGPGHGIALTQRHPGRLVVAANHTTARGSGAHLVYSDDHGRSWRVGALDHHTDGRLRPDENAVAELPDGRLYVNARDQGGSHPATRLDTYSADGGTRFTAPYQPRPKLVAPVVKGALSHADDDACPALLFTAPEHPRERRHLTVRRSTDAGRTWAREAVVAAGPAAYSDLVPTGRDGVAVLYETGATKSTERIELRRLTLTCR